MRNITTTLLRLALLSVLAIGVGAITAASASAAEPVFAFCHDFGAGNGHGTYSDAHCSVAENGGLYGVAYADAATTLLLCLWEGSEHNYTNSHCSELGSGEFEKQLITTADTPLLLGTPINAAVLKGKVLMGATEISCTTGKFETQPLEKGASSGGRLEYTNCTVKQPLKCIVTEPIVATFNDQLEGNKLDKFTGNKTNGTKTEIFTEIEYLDKPGETCSLKNKRFPIKGSQKCEGGANINTFQLLQELECTKEGSNLTIGTEEALYENKVSVTAQSGEAWGVLLSERVLTVIKPSNEKLEYSAKGESKEIEIEYTGSGKSGSLAVHLTNTSESGAYVEEAGGTCAGKSLVNTEKCTIKIKLEGKTGAEGSVEVSGEAGVRSAGPVTLK
jgi:hypothetical protein